MNEWTVIRSFNSNIQEIILKIIVKRKKYENIGRKLKNTYL